VTGTAAVARHAPPGRTLSALYAAAHGETLPERSRPQKSGGRAAGPTAQSTPRGGPGGLPGALL